jgi:HSP20 family molecular chaperone IbpA
MEKDPEMDVEGPIIGWMLPQTITAEDRVTVNLQEDEDIITMTLGLPGFDVEHADVSLEGAFLHIRARDQLDPEDVVVRTLRLSTLVDVDHISARALGSSLTVTLPKHQHLSRHIPILR